ncbi:MAG TPA: glycosyltransferase [Egibacteraceae bacterium]|nr:glycosyltransferase [Egibacteraceae bacterium]
MESVTRAADGAVLPTAGITPRRVGFVSVHTSPLEQPGSGDSGGMNVHMAALAGRLTRAGVAIDVFTRATGRDLPPTLVTADGVRVHHLQAGPAVLPKRDLASHLCAFYLALASHAATPGLDLLHGHYWMSGWVGRQASLRLGLPLVQSFHTLGRVKNERLAPGDRPEPTLRLAAEDRVAAAAHALIAPTTTEVGILRERYGAAAGQVHLVEPGVDLGVFRADGDRRAARRALGGGRIILFVGRLQPLKAPDLAVRTLAAVDRLLPDDGVPARLVIVGGPSGDGGGVDPAGLRRLARALGVEDRVALLAPRPQTDLVGLYQAADAVIVPSHSESFGLVALEAQACATPVVASAVGGLLHVVGDGGGTLVHGRDPESFAAALVPYLVDPRARARAGRNGRRKAARYDWGRTAAATLEVYRVVTARRGGREAAGGEAPRSLPGA